MREEAWPDVRDADELHDVLHTLVALPESRAALDRADEGVRHSTSTADWGRFFESLLSEGRAGIASVHGHRYWVAAERARSFAALFPAAEFVQALADVESSQVSRDDALLTLVTGWMSHLGPATASGLGEMLGLPGSDIEKALLRMEASGTVLRGNFTGAAGARTTERKRPNGVSGGCWRGFTGSRSGCCASRLSRSRQRHSCAG